MTAKESNQAFRRFEELTKRLISVPKSEIEKKAKERSRAKNGKRQKS